MAINNVVARMQDKPRIVTTHGDSMISQLPRPPATVTHETGGRTRCVS